MDSRMKTFFRLWAPPIALCVAIFLQSSTVPPDVLPHFSHSDKAVHGVVFGILALLLYRAFGSISWLGENPAFQAGAAVVAATVYGISDELHQAFVPMRTADPWDAFADAMGAFLFVAGCRWFLRIRQPQMRGFVD